MQMLEKKLQALVIVWPAKRGKKNIGCGSFVVGEGAEWRAVILSLPKERGLARASRKHTG